MKIKLILGDILAIAILTVIGFASHGEMDPAFIPRMGTTFFPVLVGWFLLAPWFGLLAPGSLTDVRFLWRAPLVMIFAAPLAAILRATLLGTSVSPLFTAVLGGSFALGMMLWRGALGAGLRGWSG